MIFLEMENLFVIHVVAEKVWMVAPTTLFLPKKGSGNKRLEMCTGSSFSASNIGKLIIASFFFSEFRSVWRLRELRISVILTDFSILCGCSHRKIGEIENSLSFFSKATVIIIRKLCNAKYHIFCAK